MRPGTIFLTGLSASGKTTLARDLVRRLNEHGITQVVCLDGEELRRGLDRTYGYTPEERMAVLRWAVAMAQAEIRAGNSVVMCSISHRRSMREYARRELDRFFEVFLDCSVEVCAARDVKGQYRRAFAGEYDCFIGVTDEYERSDHVDLRIDTAGTPVEPAAGLLFRHAVAFLQEAPMRAPR